MDPGRGCSSSWSALLGQATRAGAGAGQASDLGMFDLTGIPMTELTSAVERDGEDGISYVLMT